MKGIDDAIIDTCMLINQLKKHGKVTFNNGGDGLEWRMRTSESTIGGASSDWGEKAAQTTNPFTKVGPLDYAQYQWILNTSLFQEARNKNAGDASKMFNMAMEQWNEVRQAAISRLCTHAYGDGTSSAAGDDGTPILGLEAIISASNTYAGVARSSNSWMQAQIGSGGTAASFTADTDGDGIKNGIAAMDTLWIACKGGKDNSKSISPDYGEVENEPDFSITTDTLWLKYLHSMQPQRIYSTGKLDVNASCTYMGKPFIRDSKCTANRIYFITAQYLQLDVVGPQIFELTPEQIKLSPYTKQRGLVGQAQMYSRNPRYQGAVQFT